MGGVDAGGDPKKSTVNVNVIPMIDLLLMLLIFLLTNFANSVFEDVSALSANMPVFGASDPNDQPQDEDPNAIKSLRIRMTKDGGFTVLVETGAGTTAAEIPLAADGSFDFARLSEELAQVKTGHEEHEEALLEVEKDLPYKSVVRAMDSVREQVLGLGTKDVTRRTLFPTVSLTDTGSQS